jgi:hypothetical protein
MTLTGVDGQVAHEANEEDGEASNALPVSALANNSAPQNAGIDDGTYAGAASIDRLKTE